MTLRRLMLARTLRELRENADISLADTAAELGCTPGRVRHLESGRNLPSRPDLIVMCGLYNVPTSEREALLNIRLEAQTPGWWQTYKLPKSVADYVTLEADATSIRNWEVELIPGLLQTEDYARKLETFDYDATSTQVEQRVTARMKRQERLETDRSFKVESLVSEAALIRCGSDSHVGQNQLRRLMELSGKDNVIICVVPAYVGLHHVMAGGFALLDFPENTWPVTGYQEYAVGGHLVDDLDAVARMTRLFDELRSRAISEPDSRSMISQYISSESG